MALPHCFARLGSRFLMTVRPLSVRSPPDDRESQQEGSGHGAPGAVERFVPREVVHLGVSICTHGVFSFLLVV